MSYPHNVELNYNQNYDQQQEQLISFSGERRNLTPTIEQLMKWYPSYQKEDNSQHGHIQTQRNFIRSIKAIRLALPDFRDDVMFTDFHFSDDTVLDEQMIIKFWELWLQKHYNDNIGYSTYDQWLTVLESQLRDKVPVYAPFIRQGLTELMYDSKTETESESNSNGNNHVDSKSDGVNSVDTSSKSDSSSNNSGSAESTNKGTGKNNRATSDTPQNELMIDANNPQYASTIEGGSSSSTDDNKSSSKSTASANDSSISKSAGKNTNTSVTDGISDDHSDGYSITKSRNRPITEILDEVGQRGAFLGLMDAIDNDGRLFANVHSSEAQTSHLAQSHTPLTYPSYYGGRNPYI